MRELTIDSIISWLALVNGDIASCVGRIKYISPDRFIDVSGLTVTGIPINDKLHISDKSIELIASIDEKGEVEVINLETNEPQKMVPSMAKVLTTRQPKKYCFPKPVNA